jgi:hypothetical protein
MATNIYNMNIHEQLILDKRNTVARVPGGWIYKAFSGQEANQDFLRPIGCCFVPYSEEFEAYYKEKEEEAKKAEAQREEEESKKTETDQRRKQRIPEDLPEQFDDFLGNP